jgi:hypothetical protein
MKGFPRLPPLSAAELVENPVADLSVPVLISIMEIENPASGGIGNLVRDTPSFSFF